jgi:hypothetical protein
MPWNQYAKNKNIFNEGTQAKQHVNSTLHFLLLSTVSSLLSTKTDSKLKPVPATLKGLCDIYQDGTLEYTMTAFFHSHFFSS